MYSLSLTLCEQPKVLTHRRSVPGTGGEEAEEAEDEAEDEGRVEEGGATPQLLVIVVVVSVLALPTIFSLFVPTSDTGERRGNADTCWRLAASLALLLLPLLPLLVEILRGRTTSPTAGCA